MLAAWAGVKRATSSQRAGPLMTEDAALVATLEGGGLDVRFLSRRAKLDTTAAATASVADGVGGSFRGSVAGGGVAAGANESPPLVIPKKTKLYVEFAKRERENAQSMYHALQQCVLMIGQD